MPARERGDHQAASLLLRMARPQRDLVHQLAAARGKSTPRYLLDLIAADAAAGGAAAVAARVGITESVVVGIFRQTWESPAPEQGPGSHAKAEREMAVSVG